MATILIVDDNEHHLELLETELTDVGYRVVVMTNATDAMSYITRNRPDLIITDVAMPRYNGIELIRDILRHDESIPIIIYSAYTAYANTFMAYAADAYVSKSCDLTELKHTIGKLLAERAGVCV